MNQSWLSGLIDWICWQQKCRISKDLSSKKEWKNDFASSFLCLTGRLCPALSGRWPSGPTFFFSWTLRLIRWPPCLYTSASRCALSTYFQEENLSHYNKKSSGFVGKVGLLQNKMSWGIFVNFCGLSVVKERNDSLIWPMSWNTVWIQGSWQGGWELIFWDGQRALCSRRSATKVKRQLQRSKFTPTPNIIVLPPTQTQQTVKLDHSHTYYLSLNELEPKLPTLLVHMNHVEAKLEPTNTRVFTWKYCQQRIFTAALWHTRGYFSFPWRLSWLLFKGHALKMQIYHSNIKIVMLITIFKTSGVTIIYWQRYFEIFAHVSWCVKRDKYPNQTKYFDFKNNTSGRTDWLQWTGTRTHIRYITGTKMICSMLPPWVCIT